MKFPLTLLLLTLLLVQGSNSKDAFSTLVNYETKLRKMAGVNESQYHLLPFRLNGDQQHFLQTPTTDEMIYAEIVVHWIGRNSSLDFPSFDLTQKVRIMIEE